MADRRRLTLVFENLNWMDIDISSLFILFKKANFVDEK